MPRPSPARRPRVLVVDDDPEVRLLLAEALPAEGLEVLTASGGKAALELVARERGIALVLLDVVMPGLDGFEVCRRLRQRPGPERLRVFMLTGRNDPETIRRALQAGADGYVAKPFATADLALLLRRVLGLPNHGAEPLVAEEPPAG